MAVLLFDAATLRKLVEDTIPSTLPPDHTSALVGTVDSAGVGVVVSCKKDTAKGTWEVRGVLKHEWTGGDKAGAQVIWSF